MLHPHFYCLPHEWLFPMIEHDFAVKNIEEAIQPFLVSTVQAVETRQHTVSWIQNSGRLVHGKKNWVLCVKMASTVIDLNLIGHRCGAKKDWNHESAVSLFRRIIAFYYNSIDRNFERVIQEHRWIHAKKNWGSS